MKEESTASGRVFKIYTQKSGRKPILLIDRGVISLDRNGQYLVMDSEGNKIIATGERVRLYEIARDVMIFNGFVHIGNNKNGTKKYSFCEWFCHFID